MRLRPQFQLRFRTPEQFRDFSDRALAAGVSMNEWLLRRVEEGDGRAVERVDAEKPGGAIERTGNGAAVSVLPEAKGKAKRLRSLQLLRPELGGVVGEPVQTSEPDHKGHHTFGADEKGQWCSDCGVYFK